MRFAFAYMHDGQNARNYLLTNERYYFIYYHTNVVADNPVASKQ